MRDATDDREREETERREKAERTKEMHESDAEIARFEYDKKTVIRRQDAVKDEVHRLKTEIAREQKALDEEMRRRKTALDRLTVNCEKKEEELRPLRDELERIESELMHAKNQKKNL